MALHKQSEHVVLRQWWHEWAVVRGSALLEGRRAVESGCALSALSPYATTAGRGSTRPVGDVSRFLLQAPCLYNSAFCSSAQSFSTMNWPYP